MSHFKICPPSLLPTLYQNMSTGGVGIVWPDVCHCHINGGESRDLHQLTAGCEPGSTECHCPAGPAHIDNCPWNDCPIGQCHPMCSQVTGDNLENWCHCPCHG